MCKILIFGGTTEGRILAEYCVKNKIYAYVSVATEIGEALLEKSQYLNIKAGRMNSEEMSDFIMNNNIKTVIDATHPYAVEATKNIRTACEKCSAEYIRIQREQGKQFDSVRYFDDLNSAIQYLNTKPGIVMITTGSKELEKYCMIEDYKKRCIVRVLQNEHVLEQCINLGFPKENIISEKPPYSYEQNYSHLSQFGVTCLITKDSGLPGGFEEKVKAALDYGAEVLIIKRPKENGYTVEEAESIMKDRKRSQKKVSIIGIGMDGAETLTAEGLNAVKAADVLIGAKRVAGYFENYNKPVFITYDTEKIAVFIRECEYSSIAVLMSGDCGFYSGAKKLVPLLSDMNVKLVSGISAPVYFCAKLGLSWSDMHFISLHGRTDNIVRAVSKYERTFFLLGGESSAADVCRRLCEYSLDSIKVYIGENLASKNERIFIGQAAEFTDLATDSLCVMIIENLNYEKTIKSCIPDDSFIRGSIPMTKAEVRSICVSKLDVESKSVCWDIGSGTGSVSVELALRCFEGTVYAVDRNPDAAELTALNSRKFLCDNIIVKCGEASSEVDKLPRPDCVFIGGSGGILEKIILTAINKNPEVKIVVTAVSLETIENCRKVLHRFEIKAEINQIAVTRTVKVGVHTMLRAENPIFIINTVRNK